MRVFSYKDRPVHLGPFPLERLARGTGAVDLRQLPEQGALSFAHADPLSLSHAMARFMAMFDTVRDGPITHGTAEIPDDPIERAHHLKAAGYYFDASMVGVAALRPEHFLTAPYRNPLIDNLKEELEQGGPKSFAAGIDAIYADILDAARSQPGPVGHHTHALVFLVEHTRDPRPDEAGTDWFGGTQAQRAALLTANCGVVLANYLRMLGFEARAHSATTSEVDLRRLAVSAGLASMAKGDDGMTIENAYVGRRFGLAAVTTTMALAPTGRWRRGAGATGSRRMARPGGRARAPRARPQPRSPIATAISAWGLTRSNGSGAATRPPPLSTRIAFPAFPSAPISLPARYLAIWARRSKRPPRAACM